MFSPRCVMSGVNGGFQACETPTFKHVKWLLQDYSLKWKQNPDSNTKSLKLYAFELLLFDIERLGVYATTNKYVLFYEQVLFVVISTNPNP